MLLRRFLQLLSHSSNRFSPVFRHRTIVAPLRVRPSLFTFLGVSVATFTTIVTIHADSAQAFEDDDLAIQIRSSEALLPKSTPPSPTTDETFDLSSEVGTPETKLGISRIDTILLARYVRELCYGIYFVPFLSLPLATNPAKTSPIKNLITFLAHSTIPCLEFTMDITEI